MCKYNSYGAGNPKEGALSKGCIEGIFLLLTFKGERGGHQVVTGRVFNTDTKRELLELQEGGRVFLFFFFPSFVHPFNEIFPLEKSYTRELHPTTA